MWDPIDGTYNYLRGIPGCCVSLALMRGMDPVLGVIYDFNLKECFTGSKETGLRINGQPHTPRWADSIETGCLMTGLPTSRAYDETSLLALVHDMQRYKKVRLIGTAALAVAYVAVGRADVYHEDAIHLWDIAAGLALVNAGGGHYSKTPTPKKAFAFFTTVAGKKEWILEKK